MPPDPAARLCVPAKPSVPLNVSVWTRSRTAASVVPVATVPSLSGWSPPASVRSQAAIPTPPTTARATRPQRSRRRGRREGGGAPLPSVPASALPVRSCTDPLTTHRPERRAALRAHRARETTEGLLAVLQRGLNLGIFGIDPAVSEDASTSAAALAGTSLREVGIGYVEAVIAQALRELERCILERLQILGVELTLDSFEVGLALLLRVLEVRIVGIDTAPAQEAALAGLAGEVGVGKIDAFPAHALGVREDRLLGVLRCLFVGALLARGRRVAEVRHLRRVGPTARRERERGDGGERKRREHACESHQFLPVERNGCSNTRRSSAP